MAYKESFFTVYVICSGLETLERNTTISSVKTSGTYPEGNGSSCDGPGETLSNSIANYCFASNHVDSSDTNGLIKSEPQKGRRPFTKLAIMQ